MGDIGNRILTRIQNQDDFSGPLSSGECLVYNGSKFVLSNVSGSLLGNISINTYGPLAGGGPLSSNLTLSIPAANNVTSGYLLNTDWMTFNNKVSGPAGSNTQIQYNNNGVFSGASGVLWNNVNNVFSVSGITTLTAADKSQLKLYRDANNASSILNTTASGWIYLLGNSYNDGTNYNRFNILSPAWQVGVGELDHLYIRHVGSGVNPISSFTTLASFDNVGRLSATAHIAPPISLSISAGNISTDASAGSYFTINMTANATLVNPTNLVDGQKIIWRFVQDATGSRTLTLGTNFNLGSDISSITLTTTANKADYLTGIYNASTGKIDVVSLVRGY